MIIGFIYFFFIVAFLFDYIFSSIHDINALWQIIQIGGIVFHKHSADAINFARSVSIQVIYLYCFYRSGTTIIKQT